MLLLSDLQFLLKCLLILFWVNITCCFSFVAINSLSLSLYFAILITVSFGVDLFGLTLFETFCFLGLDIWVLFQVREVFSCYVSKYVLYLLSFSLFLLGPL